MTRSDPKPLIQWATEGFVLVFCLGSRVAAMVILPLGDPQAPPPLPAPEWVKVTVMAGVAAMPLLFLLVFILMLLSDPLAQFCRSSNGRIVSCVAIISSIVLAIGSSWLFYFG